MATEKLNSGMNWKSIGVRWIFLALSADQMKHWFIILIETTLNIGISSQKPVDSKESKHSGRLSKFFSPHWIAGIVSQTYHHMVVHKEESDNLLNTWYESDS